MSAFYADVQVGKKVKITKKEGNRLTLDIDTLKSILKPYEGFPVAVYAIVGPLRSGKSFPPKLACWLSGAIKVVAGTVISLFLICHQLFFVELRVDG